MENRVAVIRLVDLVKGPYSNFMKLVARLFARSMRTKYHLRGETRIQRTIVLQTLTYLLKKIALYRD